MIEEKDSRSGGKHVQTNHPMTLSDFGLIKSVRLEEIPLVWKVYADLKIRKRDAGISGWMKGYEQQIRNKYLKEDWRKAPVFSGYVRLHDKYSRRKGIPSSSEKLINLILKRGSVPNINTFVDVYNVVSALTGISMGAHDIDKIVGTARLEVLEEDHPYQTIGEGRHDVAKKGEYSYVDDLGILCRLDIKQCDRTKVTEETRDVLAIFQGHQDLEQDYLMQGLELLEEAINAMRNQQ